MSKSFELVVAMTRQRGIGKDGKLPWPRLPIDMKHFKDITTTTTQSDKMNVVIMGKKTWLSLPPHAKPLPNRINIILTTQPDVITEVNNDTIYTATSLDNALLFASNLIKVDKIFLIGGAQPFIESLQHKLCSTIHMTEVLNGNYPCDVFMPQLPTDFILTQVDDVIMDGIDNTIPIQYLTYTRTITQQLPTSPLTTTSLITSSPTTTTPSLIGEQGYLDLIKYCIAHGTICDDRTGVGTVSMFGGHIRYNLRNGSFPLFTTKRVFFRGVLEELLWFIKGATNSNLLAEKNVHIWAGNSTREFLDRRGLTEREVGDLGPVYGFQWRHFGAEYINFHTDYNGKGFDQLADLIHLIKTQPDSRRLLMSAWNPPQLDAMALPPCHVLCQFRVYNGELSCLLYQRSCDMALGVPFNVASYSLLTYMIAHLCGLQTGELIHVMGDIHVYKNHIEPLQQQLIRIPKEQPTLRIARPIGNDNINTIDDFVYDDFIVEGYEPYPAIKMDMAV